MLRIPDAAVPYILFQRTDYLLHPRNRVINALIVRIPFLTYHHRIFLESALFKSRIKRLFSKDMAAELETLEDALPAHADAILDIGCGVAGIDTLLDEYYRAHGQEPAFYLLDKTQVNPRVYYGFENVASYYNSFDVARNLLAANGMDAARIHTQEVDGSPIFPGERFDLIVSLISWGFHYPIGTYLDEVFGALKPGGSLIVDVRKGTGGRELLEGAFGAAQVLKDAQKHERLLLKKRA